jgi:hypothetical protein
MVSDPRWRRDEFYIVVAGTGRYQMRNTATTLVPKDPLSPRMPRTATLKIGVQPILRVFCAAVLGGGGIAISEHARRGAIG